MTTQLWVPGPAQIAVGTGAAGAMEFLGFSEDGVRIAPTARYEDVYTDLTGPAVPQDVQFFAEDATLSGTLTKFNYAVFLKLLSRRLGGTAGAIAAGDVGALMRLESRSIQLMIRSPYRTKAPYGAMVEGYRFPVAFAIDSVDVPVSVRVQRPRLTFRAIPDWASDGSNVLYDHNMTNFPAVT